MKVMPFLILHICLLQKMQIRNMFHMISTGIKGFSMFFNFYFTKFVKLYKNNNDNNN